MNVHMFIYMQAWTNRFAIAENCFWL